jgi:hypothetical protein
MKTNRSASLLLATNVTICSLAGACGTGGCSKPQASIPPQGTRGPKRVRATRLEERFYSIAFPASWRLSANKDKTAVYLVSPENDTARTTTVLL